MTTATELTQVLKYLSKADMVLAHLINAYGPYTVVPQTDYYARLVGAIIGQQLSVKAAGTIRQRFMDLYDGLPDPEQILRTDAEVLRSVGLSRGKVGYIQDLAQHVLDGRLELDKIGVLSNDEIVHELTAVKGIGEWTAHMFLIFAVGRLDVLPTGDLGVRTGMRNLYGLDHLPTPQEMRDLADKNGWHPYESIASWYMWRSLENMPKVQA